MSLPAEVTFATVVWKGLTGPGGAPYSGTVTFEPDTVDGLIAYPNASPPFTLTALPYQVALASDGTLSAPDVIAAANSNLNPTGFTTTVSFDIPGLTIPSFHIAPLTPGNTYNLTDLIPVDADGGIQGVVSTTGPQGATGATGAAGATGATGATGPAGTNGTNGVGFNPGDLKMSGATTAQTGWLLCDGSAVSRTGANAALFAAVGTAYGAGNGSTTFNVPAFTTGNFPSGTTPGATGGTATHTHTVPAIAAHTHPLSSNGQALTHAEANVAGSFMGQGAKEVTTTAWAANIAYCQASGNSIQTTSLDASITKGAVLAGTTDSAGAVSAGTSGSTSTLPPFVGVAYFIKL